MITLSSLDRKLVRDLKRMRGQVIAIALVIASGTALLVMALTTIEALQQTTNAYYERQRFADVFAQVKRAPEKLAHDIAAIPGVRDVDTRIVQFATLRIPDFDEPVVARLVSLPDHGDGVLNNIVLRSGRMADGPDEAVLSEPFAEARNLKPGDHFTAVLRGRKRTLQVVGTALSPEFIYAIPPGGLMPDDERFGIIWMPRSSLAAAFDLDGAFNSVTLTIRRGALVDDVILQLDELLSRYGGTGAVPRRDQISNWFLQNEITQQKNMAHLLPGIFLAVAAFLTNMVMARLIATERREIGLLKAFGYRDWAIGWHYAKMVLVIGGLGIVIGALAGSWLGHWNTALYAEVYRFPFLLYRPSPASYLIAGAISLGAAMTGSLLAVRRAARLAPAAAMQPPSPANYRRGWLSRSALSRSLDEPTRMILRRLLRWPLRAFLSSAGLAMAVAVLLLALQWMDAIDEMVDSYFVRAQHQDVSVGFYDIQPYATIETFKRLPGVLNAEPFRGVSARLRHGHLSKREGITGIPPDATLSPVTDSDRGVIAMPPDGLVIARKLAQILEVSVGDTLEVEVLEGRRPKLRLPVVRIFDTYIGTPAYMRLAALDRVMGDGRAINGLHLAIDEAGRAAFLSRLTEIPNVAAVLFRKAAIDKFHETMGEIINIFVGFFTAFATALAIGVTYNAARLALSERMRELATLRVLGFTRWEISYILLGEIGLLTWLAMPLGCVAGYWLALYLTDAFDTELYRVPLAIRDSTYGIPVLIVFVTAALCAAFVRSRLDHLDLIGVLKTRE